MPANLKRGTGVHGGQLAVEGAVAALRLLDGRCFRLPHDAHLQWSDRHQRGIGFLVGHFQVVSCRQLLLLHKDCRW